jgi:hypothetical protein
VAFGACRYCIGVVFRPEQASEGDEVVGEYGSLKEAGVAVAALVGAAAAAAVVLQGADGGFDAGMAAPLPGPGATPFPLALTHSLTLLSTLLF